MGAISISTVLYVPRTQDSGLSMEFGRCNPAKSYWFSEGLTVDLWMEDQNVPAFVSDWERSQLETLKNREVLFPSTLWRYFQPNLRIWASETGTARLLLAQHWEQATTVTTPSVSDSSQVPTQWSSATHVGTSSDFAKVIGVR
jgi:hypothetical protein